MSSSIQTIHCAWLIRCHEAPRADQKLTIVDGVLQEIVNVPGDERSLIRPVAVLPGLVNAHTHLEFSQLQQPLPPPNPFPEWIRSVVQYRRDELADDSSTACAVQSGFRECRETGAAIVGEICTSDAGLHALRETASNCPQSGPETVCFRELLGFTSNRIAEQNQVADAFLRSFTTAKSVSESVHPGLSPHAPYSVHPEIVHHAVSLAQNHQLPIAMHLAETKGEVQFVEFQTGEFVDLLDRLNLWEPNSLKGIARISDYLALLGECSYALAIHGNYFNPADIKWLGQSSNVTTVYCVRSHRWFGHSRHPWKQIEAAGGRVILGTDSRASNPDLSIWKELQTFCEQHPEESMIKRLPMISTGAAEALGFPSGDLNLAVGRPFRATLVDVAVQTASCLDGALQQASHVRSAT